MKLTIILVEMSAAKHVYCLFSGKYSNTKFIQNWNGNIKLKPKKRRFLSFTSFKKVFLFLFFFFSFLLAGLEWNKKVKVSSTETMIFLLKTEDKKHSNYCDKISVYGEQHLKSDQNIKPIDEVIKVKCKM